MGWHEVFVKLEADKRDNTILQPTVSLNLSTRLNTDEELENKKTSLRKGKRQMI